MNTRRFLSIAFLPIASLSLLASAFSLTAEAQTPRPTPVPTMAPIKPPAVQVPSVLPPKAPVMPSTNPVAITPPPAASTTSATAPGAAATTVAVPRAALITTAYTEAAYQKAAAAGPTLLIFSGAQDAIWVKQAPVLQTVLREAEFRAIPSFQIDVADEGVMQKFQVTLAGTLLMMKDGVERIRSSRMTNADVIRKMLRLHSAL